jgi:hypothetical protein
MTQPHICGREPTDAERISSLEMGSQTLAYRYAPKYSVDRIDKRLDGQRSLVLFTYFVAIIALGIAVQAINRLNAEDEDDDE